MNSKLVNTCPVDNFITLMSLHLPALTKSLKCLQIQQKSAQSGNMLTDIVQKNFDSLRFKISKELHIEEKMNIIDFFGSEYSMVKLLVENRLSIMRYECELKCENCSRVFKKVENITTFDKFTVNCQTLIRDFVNAGRCKLIRVMKLSTGHVLTNLEFIYSPPHSTHRVSLRIRGQKISYHRVNCTIDSVMFLGYKYYL